MTRRSLRCTPHYLQWSKQTPKLTFFLYWTLLACCLSLVCCLSLSLLERAFCDCYDGGSSLSFLTVSVNDWVFLFPKASDSSVSPRERSLPYCYSRHNFTIRCLQILLVARFLGAIPSSWAFHFTRPNLDKIVGYPSFTMCCPFSLNLQSIMYYPLLEIILLSPSSILMILASFDFKDI